MHKVKCYDAWNALKKDERPSMVRESGGRLYYVTPSCESSDCNAIEALLLESMLKAVFARNKYAKIIKVEDVFFSVIMAWPHFGDSLFDALFAAIIATNITPEDHM